jgi:competence protein ComEC
VTAPPVPGAGRFGGLDLRLAVPASVGWLTAAVLVGVPALAGWVAGAAWVAAAVAASRRAALVAACLGAAGLLGIAVAGHEHHRAPPELVHAAENAAVVDGLVRIDEQPSSGRSVAGTLLEFTADGRAWAVAAPVRLVGGLPPVAPGAEVTVTGEVVRGDAGDSAAFVLFARDEARLRASPSGGPGIAADLRESFRSTARALGGDGGALLPGLALGDTSAVGADLEDAMRAGSLSHLTAVSGANCAVVVGLVMGFAGTLRLPLALRVGSALGALGGFVVLVTPEPSVARAAVMGGIVLVAMAGGRPFRGVPVLAAAAGILLVGDPWLSRDFGFLLSVLATGALLVLAGPLAGVLGRWMPLPIAVLLSVPLSAQLVCAPVLVLLDPALPVYGVAANLLAGVAAPAATIAGLGACVLLPLVPPIGTALAQLAWLPAAWIAAVARVAAAAPGATVDWLPGWPGALALAAATGLVLFAILARRGAGQRVAALGSAILLAVVAGAALGGPMLARTGRPANWSYALCDVGQGDALVVRSAGKVAVVDTGPDPRLVADCLRTLGVGTVDLLVLSHFDLDHVGGAEALLGRASRVLTGPPGSPDDERLVADFRAAGATVDEVARGQTGVLGRTRWRVLWPLQRSPFEPGNESSVVLELLPLGDCSDGCISAMLLGDLGEAAQEAMARAGPVPDVELVKVSHHGSADQSATLYRRLSALVGLFPVGENRYGHPTARALGLLRAAGSEVFRSDRDGLVLVAENAAGELQVWTERPG